MKALWKATLLAGVAYGVLAAPAFAQDAAPSDDTSAVDEVIVTARRREETLKDVPVAVTPYSAEKLDLTGARDITDLTKTTPSMTMQPARGSNSTLIAFIRGVGQQDPLWGFEPGVGLYVDDVYIARPQGAVLDIFDIQRIEVLRGPQGTLYGRNTIGGAVKYVTDKIGPDAELKLKGAYGSYNQIDLIASGEARLSDEIGISGAVARYTRDGYGKNLNTGAEHYNKDVTAARATIEFTPNDDLFFRLSGDITRDDSNPRHGHRLLAPSPSDVYDTYAGSGDDNRVENRGLSLLGEWQVNDKVTLKSITAYRAGQTDGTIDFDNTASPTLDIPARYRDHQFTQELQVLYQGERAQGVLGLFYLNGTASGAFDTVLGLANLTIATAGEVDTRSLAAFGDFSFDLTDKLSVSLGGRWTQDTKEGYVYRQNFTGIRSPLFGNSAAIPGLLRTNPALYAGRELDFEDFTPRVSISYDFTPLVTGYASYSQGFKSGGFDMRGDAYVYAATVNGFKPETVDTYEVGLKGSLFDNRVNFATALFKSDYKDTQITTQYPVGLAIASVVDNAGAATIQGWEFEGSAQLMDGLTANLMLSYIDAGFDEFRSYIPTGPLNSTCPSLPGCVVDVSDSRDIQNTPEWTGAFNLAYQRELGDGHGTITFTPSAAYRGASQMFELANPILDQGSYWLYDASLVWTSESDKYRLGLHGKNLSDEQYRVGGYNFPGALFGNSIIGYYGAPRTVTATFEVKF
ncbi:TonB-dependent receptor [Caulobacter sp. 17J80-11]|uniref:TonB-dependent receptor n=1 Tax=Caulobacter sp. 17J80-11 TaxID=2763502 RepID=UPI001653418A|nr:TonB-dependent receptor [Caulobacter sp. 17J80-11]MBC6983812.1 TonB-dependent receptor [Caulobacter sp. 17J80-11]